MLFIRRYSITKLSSFSDRYPLFSYFQCLIFFFRSWSEAFNNYDSSDIAFNPSIPKVPPPKKDKQVHPLQAEKIIREKYTNEFFLSFDQVN